MKNNNNFVAVRTWISRTILLVLVGSAIAACGDQSAKNPDVVVVSPSPSPSPVSPSPSPSPTSTTVVSPTPLPSPTSTTVVVVPTASPSPTSTTVVVVPTASPSPTSTTGAGASPSPSPAATSVVITEPITDVVVITTAPSPAALANKRVQFTDVKVQSVIGDRPFWVGRSNNERLAVVLDPALDNGSAENKIVVKAGQTLNVTGVLKPMPTAEQAQKLWKLKPEEAQGLQSQAVYLQADKITFKKS